MTPTEEAVHFIERAFLRGISRLEIDHAKHFGKEFADTNQYGERIYKRTYDGVTLVLNESRRKWLTVYREETRE